MILATPAGPVEFVPRDFDKMPRNWPTTTRTDPAKLRGVTVHYTGGGMASYYRDKPIAQADEEMVARTIRNHCARTNPDGSKQVSDVGYQLLVGRSGICWEGRGLDFRNAANGALTTAAKPDYPPGTESSNPYWQSMMLCVGTDPGYDQPTAAQWETARRLAAYIADRFDIADCKVNGHRDVRATACPGLPIYSRLAELVPGPMEDEMMKLIQPVNDTTVLRLGLDGTCVWVKDGNVLADLIAQGLVDPTIVEVSRRSLSAWELHGPEPIPNPTPARPDKTVGADFAKWVP